jgi:hypothetical protein
MRPFGQLARYVLGDSRWFATLAGLTVLMGAVPALAGRLQPDTAWLLYASDHMLRGSRLYVDLVETNPPLIVWLDALPVVMGRLLGLPSGPMYMLLTLALALGSAACCAVLLGRIVPEAPLLRRFLGLLILGTLLPLARLDFGQREHLFLALALPYLLLTVLRLQGQSPSAREAWVTGIAAGLGIALKPYFVLLWLTLEVLNRRARLQGRGLRPESLAIVVVGSAYLLAVVLVAPEYFQLVRLLGSPYHTFLRNPLITTALLGDGAQLPMLAFLGYLALRADAEHRLLWTTLAWSMAALWLAAVLQQKGWRYHFYPAMGLAVLLCGLMVVDRCRAAGSSVRRLYAAAVAASVLGAVLLTAGACIRQIVDPRNPRYDPDPDLSRLVPVVAAYRGQPVLMLSWSTASAFPLMTYADAENASRFNHLWLAGASYWNDLRQPGPLRYHTRPEMSPSERFLVDALVEDVARTRPSLALVLRPGPDRPEWGLRRLDFLAYLNGDPRFARLWSEFTYAGQVGEYWVFRRAHPGEATVLPPARPMATREKPVRGLDASFGLPALNDVGLWLFSAVLLVICLVLQRRWDGWRLDSTSAHQAPLS